MISSPWRPGIALATQVLEFCKVLDLFYKVLEFLQEGICWTSKFKSRPEPKHPKNVKDLAKLKDLCGKGNAWTPRAGDHGRKGLTNEITRG